MCSDFLQTALAHYRQEISKSPKDLSIYQHQLLFCMKFARYDEAVQCLEKAQQNLPAHWWPQFALDLVENRLGNRPEQNRFERWVEHHPTYLSYGCLVWLYKLENKPSEAAKAGEMMLQFEPRDDPPFILRSMILGINCIRPGLRLFSASKQLFLRDRQPAILRQNVGI
jgi:tetratricopeptide (TPR) repeat protein